MTNMTLQTLSVSSQHGKAPVAPDQSVFSSNAYTPAGSSFQATLTRLPFGLVSGLTSDASPQSESASASTLKVGKSSQMPVSSALVATDFILIGRVKSTGRGGSFVLTTEHGPITLQTEAELQPGQLVRIAIPRSLPSSLVKGLPEAKVLPDEFNHISKMSGKVSGEPLLNATEDILPERGVTKTSLLERGQNRLGGRSFVSLPMPIKVTGHSMELQPRITGLEEESHPLRTALNNNTFNTTTVQLAASLRPTSQLQSSVMHYTVWPAPDVLLKSGVKLQALVFGPSSGQPSGPSSGAPSGPQLGAHLSPNQAIGEPKGLSVPSLSSASQPETLSPPTLPLKAPSSQILSQNNTVSQTVVPSGLSEGRLMNTLKRDAEVIYRNLNEEPFLSEKLHARVAVGSAPVMAPDVRYARGRFLHLQPTQNNQNQKAASSSATNKDNLTDGRTHESVISMNSRSSGSGKAGGASPISSDLSSSVTSTLASSLGSSSAGAHSGPRLAQVEIVNVLPPEMSSKHAAPQGSLSQRGTPQGNPIQASPTQVSTIQASATVSEGETQLDSKLVDSELANGKPAEGKSGQVIGLASGGRPIVRSGVETLILQTRMAPPEGTQLFFRTTPISENNKIQVNGEASLSLAGEDNPAFVRDQSWRSLETLIAHLATHDPATLGQVRTFSLPQPSSDLAAQVVLLLFALRKGGARSWLGQGAFAALDQIGAGAVGRRVRAEFPTLRSDIPDKTSPSSRSLGRSASSSKPEWKSLILPLETCEGLCPISFQWHSDSEESAASNKMAPRKEMFHFKLGFEVSHLGKTEILGSLSERVLSLTMDTETALSSSEQNEVRDIVSMAAAAFELKGQMSFQSTDVVVQVSK